MSESEKDFIIRDENSNFWRRVLCINTIKPKTCFIIIISILLIMTSLLTLFGVLTIQYITSSNEQSPQLAFELPVSSCRAKRSLADNKISQYSSENAISKREAVESEEEDIDKVLSTNFGKVNKNDEDEERNLYKRSNYLRNSIQELQNTLEKSEIFAKSIANKPIDRETANLIEKDIRDAEEEINGLDDDIVSILEFSDLTDKSARKRVRHKRSFTTSDVDPLPSAYSHYAPILAEKKREKRLIQQKLTEVRDEFIRCKKSVGSEHPMGGDNCERVYSKVIDRFKQITQKFKEIESIVGEMEVISKPKRKSEEASSEEVKKDKKKKKKKDNKKDSSEEFEHHSEISEIETSSVKPQNSESFSSSTKAFSEETSSTTTTIQEITTSDLPTMSPQQPTAIDHEVTTTPEFSSTSSQSEITTTEMSSTSATMSTTSEITSITSTEANPEVSPEPRRLIVQPENLHEETSTIAHKIKNSAHQSTRESDSACPASNLKPQRPASNFINNHGFVPEFNKPILGSKYRHDDHVIREAEIRANPILEVLDTIADRIEHDLENQIDLSPPKKKQEESAESTEIAAAPRETFTSLCDNLSKTSSKQAAQLPQDNQNFAPIQFTNPHFLPPTGEVKGSSKVVMNAGYSGIMPYPICFVQQQQYQPYRQTPMPYYPMYFVPAVPFPTQPQSGGNAQHIDPRSHGYFMAPSGRPPMGPYYRENNPEDSKDPSFCTFVAQNDANLPAYFEPTTPKPKISSDENTRSDRNSYNIPSQYDVIYATYPNQIFAMNHSMQHHHCEEGKLPCFSTNQCISKSKWCDSKVDCVDASDETACSCKARLDESRICDGFIDCPMGSDELGCFGCDKFQYSCYSSREEFEQNGESAVSMCYSSTEKCDGFSHCRNSRDEIECSMIVKNWPSATTSYLVSHSEGVLHRNYKGRWYPVCKNAMKWANEACEAELGNQNQLPPQLFIKNAQISGLFIQPSMNSEKQLIDIPPLITEFCQLEKGLAEGENQLVLVKCPKPSCGKTKVRSFERIKRQTEVAKEDELKESRIVGGSDALPGEFPFIVAIFKDGNFHCGGSIYNEHWIITAAHCTRAFENHHYEIRAGILRRSSHSPSAHITKVTHVIRHPEYERSTMKNDIALMRVKHHFSFNRWIRPICLPSKERTGIDDWMFGPKAGTICSTLGWGAIHERGSSPDDLKVVEVPILSKCKYLNDREGESICAGEKVGLKDACQGDSGGPLVCRSFSDSSEWYLSGIVSHGEGCARANEPGVYTRTALYLDWITENIGKPLPTTVPIQACPGMTCVWGAQKCIPKSFHCNGVVNCLGGEDEINCPLDIFDLMVGENQKEVNKTSSIDPNKNPDNIKDTKNVFKKALNEVFRCTRISQVINKSQRCDRVVDCEDGSDERNCTCKDHLKGNFAKLICDGHVDCADSTDEIGCMTCKENEFLCPQSKTCIEKSKHCDGEPNCLFKEDELECVTLTDGKSIILDINEKPFMHRKGIVTRNMQSKWKILCDHDGDLRQNPAQVAEDICNVIGFKSAKSHKLVDLATSNIKIDNINVNNTMIRSVEELEKAEDEKCLALEIECSSTQSSSFAVQPMHNFKIKKNVTAQTSPEIHHIADLDSKDPTKISFKTVNPNVWDHLKDFDWPWNAEIFIDGEIISNGVLLENSWILAEKSLLSNIENKNHHVTAMLGNAKSHLNIKSPYEQISRIDCDHKIENSNAVLLHLEKQIHFNRHIMPSFLHQPNDTDKDTRCIAIALSSQKITKTLELKMIPNCQNDVHLTCYQVASNKSSLCTDSDTSHRVATIMCKKKESSWYPKAFHRLNKGFCDFNEPVSVFALDNSDIYKQVQPILDMPCLKCATHNFPNATCETHRCLIGTCLRSDHVCDGIEDCRDGSDETQETCSKIKEKKNCARHEFRCKNGKCVDKKGFCDHKKDCEDGSDEPNECTCFDFLRLTEPSKLCDGITHCWDRSDENAVFCGSNCEGKFKCDGSIFCIPYEQVCDQRNDCPNGNDEKHCLGLFETSNGFGEVAERFLGLWHTKCFLKSRPPTQEDVEVICKDLGYKNSINPQAIVKGNLEGLNVINTPHLKFISMEIPAINATKVVPFSKFSPAALNDGFTIHIKSGKSLGKIVAWEKEDHENCLRMEIKCN